MSDDVPVVWLDGEHADASREASRALAPLTTWARARGITLVPPNDAESIAAIPLDLAIADRVEGELERAHEAIAAQDSDAADRALARAETLVREHPELPQAAWLRAEVERSWAARFSRIEPRDDLRAAEAWRNAEALDGGRLPGVGEHAVPRRPTAAVRIVVEGGSAHALTLLLDGTQLAATEESASGVAYEALVVPTEHQLVVSRDGQPVFASWVGISASRDAARIVVSLASEGDPCSRRAFASISRDDRGGVAATGISCPRWIAAAAGSDSGSVWVARCERDSCARLVEWRAPDLATPAPRTVAAKRGIPSWATWTVVGLGAATAAAITLVATGAFAERPVDVRFVSGGARVE